MEEGRGQDDLPPGRGHDKKFAFFLDKTEKLYYNDRKGSDEEK